MLIGEWTRIDLRMSTKYGSINHAESGYVELGQIRRESFFSKYKNSIVGVSLSLISGALFTGNNFIINLNRVSVCDLVLIRSILQLIIYTSICYYKDESFLPGTFKEKILIISQGVAAAMTFITALASVTYMAVPDALCIVFSCPVVTIILSAIILKDRLTVAKVTSGVLLLFGVILVCKPPFIFDEHPNDDVGNGTATMRLYLMRKVVEDYPHYYIGVLLAVISCCSGGLMNVLISMCHDVSNSVLVAWSAVAGLAISLIYCVVNDKSYILSSHIVDTTLTQWLTFLGLSISGLLAFTTLTKSLQLISPSLVASLRCLELVLAFSVQIIISGSVPDLIVVIGAFLISLGVIILAFQKKIKEFQDKLKQMIKDYWFVPI